MRKCSNCSHDLATGRFCTSCGHPVPPGADTASHGDWRTDTAERTVQMAAPTPAPSVPAPTAAPPPPPSSVPPPPPPGAVPPSPPRYPLYADEVDDERAEEHTTRLDLPVVPDPEPAHDTRARRTWPVMVTAGVVLLLVVGLGAAWLRSGDDDRRPGGGSTSALAGDVASQARVEVPATAPPNQDTAGNRVEYGADNLIDGVPETCWRMSGDGSGEQITITLPGKTTLRRVGLVNGYAKAARDAQGRELDWYHGNRRVLSVQWVFDDGTTLTQDLEDTTALQSLDLDVATTTVTLRLVTVSAPGAGPARRDYTAISDISLVAAGD